MGMLGSLVLIPKFRVISHEKLDLAPSMHWAAPVAIEPPEDDRGPIMITVEYHVTQEHLEDYLKLMKRLRLQRLRTGAFQWSLFTDSANSVRYVEVFLSDSWAEHLRQHGRVTKSDREIEDAIIALLQNQEAPMVTHLIHTDMKPLRGKPVHR
jgi:hypothetical protein